MKKLFIVFAGTVICFAVQAQKLPTVKQTNFRKDTLNIIKYGAVADGVTLNTKSINNAIADCNKKGGGVVLVPAGFWLTGPIVLQSNVNLHITSGGLLQFTKDFDQYPLVEGNWEGVKAARNQSPISAINAVNIGITGSGVIDGNGDAWRMVKKDKLTESQWKKLTTSGGITSDDNRIWYPTKKTLLGSQTKDAGILKDGKTVNDFAAIKDFLRPNLLVFNNCKTVLLEGVTFQNSPAWCLHPLMCQDLTIKNIYAKNPWYAQNGDGIDIESCKNVLLENSTFDVGDDGICIKSGRDEDGRKRGMPTENVTVKKCIVYHAHGGFVIGSEMSGSAKNIYVSDCSFLGTDIGLRFKTTRGRGGIVENIYINNINMKDIAGEAILFDMYYMAKDPVPLAGEVRDAPKVELLPVTEATPQFRNFYVKDIVCDGAEKAVFIRGLPEMNVKNVVMENMVLQAKKGIQLEESSGISFKNVQLVVSESNPLVNILNSNNISFDKLNYNSADLLFNLRGDRTGNVKVINTKTDPAKEKVSANAGAKETMIEIK
ncbi:glycoside hydrolase family 28 protein [Chitinophagaceae bacterium LWZ2-11]